MVSASSPSVRIFCRSRYLPELPLRVSTYRRAYSSSSMSLYSVSFSITCAMVRSSCSFFCRYSSICLAVRARVPR